MQNTTNQLIAQFQDFRQKLYNCFESCSDACMDLLDALAGNTGADSIVELSLSPLFARSYNSIYKEYLNHLIQLVRILTRKFKNQKKKKNQIT